VGDRTVSDSDLPLKDIRVLDLGIITAGAATSAMLADLGAEVIKIEAPNYIDPFRVWVDFEKTGDWWNSSPYFNFTNRNKKSLCIDLKKAAGRDIFLRLVAVSDVLVENFRRGVMDRLGLGRETLHKVNPSLIVAAISSQGETGPERDVSSFGSTLEATSGMAFLAGAPEGPPVLTGRELNYPDQVVALFAAGMITAALLCRKESDTDAHLDISQRELSSFLLGEKFLSDGSVPDCEGNADFCMPYQTIARAADGTWIAMTNTGKTSNTPESCALDFEELVSKLSADAALSHLKSNGLAQSAVLDGKVIHRASWFSRSNAFATSPDGKMVKGFPFQFRETPMHITRPTPTLGQDTYSVLGELLKLSTSELDSLTDAGVIGNKPLGKENG
jgi:crotonobetainyl-CoA:carnitine CoA-transferase CaiB-like acyl-CoA transferase